MRIKVFIEIEIMQRFALLDLWDLKIFKKFRTE